MRAGLASSLLTTEATVLSTTTLKAFDKILLTGRMNVLPYTFMLVKRTDELTSWDLKVLIIHGLPPHTRTNTHMDMETSKGFCEVLIR